MTCSRTRKRPEQMVSELYIRVLGRPPTVAEMGSLDAQIAQAGPENKNKVMVDIFWALLNTQEFMFNH